MERFAAAATVVVLYLGVAAASYGGVLAVASDGLLLPRLPQPCSVSLVRRCIRSIPTSPPSLSRPAKHVSTGGAPCDSPLMASQLTSACHLGMETPGILCCVSVLMIVEQNDKCLCWVADEPEFIQSDLSIPRVWEWYKECNGRRSVPEDHTQCEPGSPPPPPPPPAAKPEQPSGWPLRLRLAVGLLCAAAVTALAFVALKIWIGHAKAPAMIEHDQSLSEANVDAPTGSQLVGDEEFKDVIANDDPLNPTATVEMSSSDSAEESPPHSPPHVQDGMQPAVAHLPAPLPFEPIPLPMSPAAIALPVPPLILAA